MQTALINSAPGYPTPWSAAIPAPGQTKHFQRGEIITVENAPAQQPYQLLAGEVVILRQGRPVDLIEPGEWLAGWGWPDAIAVAWSDAVLVTNG